MNQNSKQQQAVIDSQKVREMIDAIAAINAQAINLSKRIDNVAGIISNDDILSQINGIINNINDLAAKNTISGGNLYVSRKAPDKPQENDIWFDLSLVRR